MNSLLVRFLTHLLLDWRRRKLAYMAQWRAAHPNAKKEWDSANSEHVRDYETNYRNSNKSHRKLRMREWRVKNALHRKAYKRQWERSNPEKARAQRARTRTRMYANNPAHALRKRLKVLLLSHLRNKCRRRSFDIVGCESRFFVNWIASQFLPGMSFENRGKWHLDHVFPVSCCGPEEGQALAAQHYRNLRPLWGQANRSKTDKLTEDGLVSAFLCGIKRIYLSRKWQATDDLIAKAKLAGFEIITAYK